MFRELNRFFSREDTLYIVARIKRGLGDTSKNGAFTKDYIYLNGYFNVKTYLKNNDLTPLYVGSIGLNDIENVKKLLEDKILIKPKYLIEDLE